jgi:hypothetical protein
VLTQRNLDSAASHAFDILFLNRGASDPQRASLRVYGLAGEIVSMGRYHLAPAGDPAGGVSLHRRLGGGRVLPLGPGFTVLTLTLPHRSALVGSDPRALRAEQVLNRSMRALLGGLRGLGIDAFYPGRDRITVDGRMLGMVSLAIEDRGVTAVEAVLAIDGDWLVLPNRVAAVDSAGALAVEVPTSDQVTTLAAHGATPSVDELASCVAGSYAQQFGVTLSPAADPVLPADAAARGAAWIASRRWRAGLDRHAVEWGQLGVFEVYLSVREGRIEDVLLAGDFIADAPSIARLEQGLRGCPLTPAAVAAVVDAVYADPDSFLLGLGPPRTVVDTILRA